MDGFMGAGVHAFGAKKPTAKKNSPKVKGAVKTSPKCSCKC